MRAARRRRRIADFDPFEALYRAYLTAIILVVAVLVLSSITGDTKVTVAEVARIQAHGGAWVGLAAALAFAVGLRSGGRGGPLVVEAADVRHVLLAPVDRGIALRGPAVRQLRFILLIGAGTGAARRPAAPLRRLPGAPFGWVACGAVVGAVTVAGAFGLAMIVSGLGLRRWIAGLLALAVLAWSAVDIVLKATTSPASLLGQLALWPLEVHAVDVVGVVIVLAAVPVGLVLVGATSLEASERRASLVGQIRFAATLQDLRTVIVLRRQLAQELPRQRPWVRLRRSVPTQWLVTTPPGPDGAAVSGAPLEAAAGSPASPVWSFGRGTASSDVAGPSLRPPCRPRCRRRPGRPGCVAGHDPPRGHRRVGPLHRRARCGRACRPGSRPSRPSGCLRHAVGGAAPAASWPPRPW